MVYISADSAALQGYHFSQADKQHLVLFSFFIYSILTRQKLQRHVKSAACSPLLMHTLCREDPSNYLTLLFHRAQETEACTIMTTRQIMANGGFIYNYAGTQEITGGNNLQPCIFVII